MTKADALPPIIALEATVVGGRTYQAYKRGKWDEARERFIEESMGSIVWLCGVKYLNKLGDKIVARMLKSNGQNFDVGTDKILRTPFDNFMKNIAPKGFTEKQVALIKGGKVLTSIVLANLFIGFVVPKLNQALTVKLRHERKVAAQQNNNSSNQPVFKGRGFNAINVFTNTIENTNVGQLLSSDVGIAGGRMYNARKKEERREIAIRDIGSIYFYMWAQGHVRNLLNMAETGHAARLNPATTEILNKYLTAYLEKNGNEVSVSDFKTAVLGKGAQLPEGLEFEKQELSSTQKLFKKQPLEVIKMSEARKVITDKEVLERAEAMSKLQPLRRGEAVITKQQLIDAFNKAEINNPKLLDEIFTAFTGGDNKSEYKFVSENKMRKLKTQMEQYVDGICKASKNNKVDKKLLEITKSKNLMYSGINFAAGFVVAAMFLSTLIPKFQYWFTRKTTGVDAFPGVYDFEHHKEVDA